MSNNEKIPFEPPWADRRDPQQLFRESCPKCPATMADVVCRLELLLRLRERLSCPGDDVDACVLSAVHRALDGVRSATTTAGRRDVMQQAARQNCGRTLIRDAIAVIEKTLKMRTKDNRAGVGAGPPN